MSLASGVGLVSGLNFQDIISKLRQANSQPVYQAQRAQNKINTQRQSLQSLNKLLLDFKSKAEAVSQGGSFLSMTSTTSDFSVASAVTSGSSGTEGEYAFYVRQLAQAHRLASQGVATSDNTSIAAAGGTFKYKVGSAAEISIEVTAGMTLQELRDRINAASSTKVRSSIISDGTATNPYRLVLTATETGQDNAISITNNDTTLNLSTKSIEAAAASSANAYNGTITTSGTYTGSAGHNIVIQMTTAGAIGAAKYKVSLDGGLTWSANDAYTTTLTDVDVTGAAAEGVNVRFTPDASPVNFAVGDRFTIDTFVPELQKAQNAIVEVDGITASRSTNTFSEVVEGVTLTAKKVSSDVQRLKVENSTGGVAAKIKDFATAYNAVVDAVAKETAYNKETKAGAALFGDAGALSIAANLRQAITGTLSVNATYSNLSSIGLTVDAKGHLSVDSSKLTEALDENLTEVRRLFIEAGTSASSWVELSKSTADTKTGSYTVEVTAAAEQAKVLGGRVLEPAGLTAGETLTITLNERALSVTLAAGEKLDEIVDALNTQFADDNFGLLASNEGGKLKIASTEYGSGQTAGVFSNRDGAAAGQLGIGSTLVSDTGVDVAGKIGGWTASGTGQILKGSTGSNAAGLALKITATAPLTTTFSLTHGTAMETLGRIAGMTDSTAGLFAVREAGYNARLKEYDSRIEALSKRLDAEEARMRKQFNGLESKLAAMQSQGNFLLSQLASLVGAR